MKIATLGIDKIDINKFHSSGDFAPDFNRPNFGMFGSTIIEKDSRLTTEWLEYARKIQYDVDRYEHGYSYQLKDSAKILTIDTEKDYVDLLNSQYRLITKMYKDKTLLSIDWNLVAKDYDALHLTKQGYQELQSLSSIFLLGKDICVADFSSYDCETWVLFNLDCIDENTIETICLDNG